MKLSELMKNHTPSTSFEGFVTNDDFVLAVDCSADGNAASAADYAVVQIGVSGLDAQLNPVTQDKQYIREKGWNTVADHAADFVSKRLAPAEPKNDGKQTPMRGHPVFIAQHATACCCRGCLAKWHGIPQGVPLSAEQQVYIVGMLMSWMRREMEN